MKNEQAQASWRRRLTLIGLGTLLVWFMAAYMIVPTVWKRYERRRPALDDMPRITHTRSDIPGDPLNVMLIGTETDVKRIMMAAKWYPADPLTLRSRLEIAETTVLKRPYDEAPVSDLYLWGRKQDLAFEKPMGNDPRQRHHVRFWQSNKQDEDGRPLWAGAVTYDKSVGLSHTTGQITHHIDADVDAERDYLFRDLERTKDLVEVYTEEGFHQVREGKNGGGDRWHTDGNVFVGVIAPHQ